VTRKVRALAGFALAAGLACGCSLSRDRDGARTHIETGAAGRLTKWVIEQTPFRREDRYGKGAKVYANPRDGAGFPDLYQVRFAGPRGQGMDELRLIDVTFARATSPDSARNGYWFADIPFDSDGNRWDYSKDAALCAMPAVYGKTGRKTFIVRTEDKFVYAGDNGGPQITRRPGAEGPEELRRDWVLFDE